MILSGSVHDGDTVVVDQTGGQHLELTDKTSEHPQTA